MSENFLTWTKIYNIKSAPLVHVGAHLVQERDDYRELGFEPVLWFEVQPEIAERAQKTLESYTRQEIRNTGLWSYVGKELELYVAGNEGSSSSFLEPYLISASHPEVSSKTSYKIETSTLDFEIGGSAIEFKVLVLDVQGAELEVLKGGVSAIEGIDYIFSEISTLELYKNGALAKDLSHYLQEQGFVFAASHLNRDTGWGEGLFIREAVTKTIPSFQVSHDSVGKLFPKGRIFRTLLIRLKSTPLFKFRDWRK